MKYKDLIQFDPIDEIIKFGQLDNEDYRAKLVKNFVCSNLYETHIIPQICAKLDLNATTETKGIQIVGNYGTGKSHLMSLFSIIAENADYLPLLQSQKAKEWLKTIAGKYMVYRFELGNNQELWDIVCYQIDKALAAWGVDYSISEDTTPATYSEKLQLMMAAFEEVHEGKGFMLVIDEMLSYLKGRSEPSKLNRDLAVLQAFGQMSDRTHFRMVFGVQELIYRSPEFQFAKEMLSHVNERYIDLTIQKEDVQFIVQQRLLQKNEHQKAQIRQHLSQFTVMFPHMNNNLDTYVNLFPVHPSYFENFSLIRIGKSQREVLKTLSRKFASIMEDDVPNSEPGLICYDSYWQDMLSNVDLKADPDVSKVSDIAALIDQKIEDNFTRGLAPKKKLAHRIVSAASIKMLQADLSHANGVTADSLANDLCHIDSTCENYDELVDLAFTRVLDSIVSATIGQYFEKGESNEYHLRIEGGVNYEQKVKDYTLQMSPEQKDEYFFKFLAEVLPVEGDTYRTGFNIWPHAIEWQSHKCNRAGYIFMGNPSSRSTTHPQQHFYIYFMPIFNNAAKSRGSEIDSVYFIMDGLSEEFKQKVTLYGSALSQEGSASSDEKPKYKLLREKYFKEARNLFNEQLLTNTQVEYVGEQHPLQVMQGAQGDSKIDIVSNVTSFIMEQQFETENPCYPKFTALLQPLTKENRENMLRSARSKIANPMAMNRNGEAILMGLGLWEDGHLSTEHSQYARSLKQKLESKGGQVVNRDEILELFFADTHEYLSSDFHIESDLQMLVMGTMAALGEIEIVLNGGNRLNASNIACINNIAPQDNYSFSNICPPKGINIPLIRELMIGFLGIDRTAELDVPNSSVFADLSSKAKNVEDRVVTLQHRIHNGYSAAGVEIISADEARSLNNEFDRLKGMANQIQRYNSKAKMRNIEWSLDLVRTTMQETRQKLEKIERMLKELREFDSYISYLRTALSNINEPNLRKDICDAIDKLKDVVGKDEAERNAYKAELDALKNRYADWYMGEYVKAHVCEMDYQKVEALKASENYAICEIVSEASFINPSRYELWKQNLAMLKLANPQVTKQAILSMPTSIDSFNPTVQRSQLPDVGELKEELNDIYENYVNEFSEALEDPTTHRNRELLNADEKSLIEQFESEQIKLNRQFARPLIEIINKLQRNFTKIEISHDDMLRIFSRPMTKQQAIDALTEYIEQKSTGHRPEDIRIIIK